jgi:hypothetical protein
MQTIALMFIAPALLAMATLDQVMIWKLNKSLPEAKYTRFPYRKTQMWIGMRTDFRQHFPQSKLHLAEKLVVWAMVIGIAFRYLTVFARYSAPQ